MALVSFRKLKTKNKKRINRQPLIQRWFNDIHLNICQKNMTNEDEFLFFAEHGKTENEKWEAEKVKMALHA